MTRQEWYEAEHNFRFERRIHEQIREAEIAKARARLILKRAHAEWRYNNVVRRAIDIVKADSLKCYARAIQRDF